MEKRKYTRFRTQHDAYAALRGSFAKVGKIYDISLNGLAFRYLLEKNLEETFTHVDIFLKNDGFYLAGVPCTIICDIKDPTFRFKEVSLYRCGLKFGLLNEEQQNKLEEFLNKHTNGEVKL